MEGHGGGIIPLENDRDTFQEQALSIISLSYIMASISFNNAVMRSDVLWTHNWTAYVCVCLCVCERERERDCGMCVSDLCGCVCERERERKRVFESVCVLSVCLFEIEREKVSVSVRESMCVCV